MTEIALHASALAPQDQGKFPYPLGPKRPFAREIYSKRSGSFPYQKHRFFSLQSVLNQLKLRATYDTGVPTKASNSFEFLAKAESFWELHSAISAGTGGQRTRRELFTFGELL